MRQIKDYNDNTNEMSVVFFITAVLFGMFFGALLAYLVITNYKIL